MAQTTDKIPLNIILIGKAGHGKSATGNSILGRTAFKTSPHLHSGTRFVADASAGHGPYEIKVVDGPGLEVTDLDGVKNKEQMFEKMAKALSMCKGGIHVFVLVIKFGFRYTEGDRKAISDLKQMFGENYLKTHGIIVITRGDSFPGQMEEDGTPGKTFNEWCREQDKVLGILIQECSPRVVLFNNISTSEEEKTRQRNELLFHAEKLQKVKALDTTEDFQTYAQVRSKFIKDSKQTSLEETRSASEPPLEETRPGSEPPLEETRPGSEPPVEETRPGSEPPVEETRPGSELLFHAGQLQKESTPTCGMAQTSDRIPLNILLIGKTGHGKSATGNSILGRQAFKRGSNPQSETKDVTDAWAEHGPYEIKVVDGPGLEDTDLDAVTDKEQACENMAKALMMCNGGIHAFVLVFKFGTKYTKEERKTIYDLKQIFGENYLQNHGIIVITGGDSFPGLMEADGTSGKTFNEWCREQEKYFGNLIEECSPRVVMFNNISKSKEEKTRQRNELLFHAGQLQKEKGLYTTEHFQEYAQLRDKLIKDSKQKMLKETIQKRIDLLSAELGLLSTDSSPEDVDKLDARIKDVYTEIGEESLQEESMQPLIGSLKRLSTSAEEFRRAILENSLRILPQYQEELNKTRQTPWGSIAVSAGIQKISSWWYQC